MNLKTLKMLTEFTDSHILLSVTTVAMEIEACCGLAPAVSRGAQLVLSHGFWLCSEILRGGNSHKITGAIGKKAPRYLIYNKLYEN